MLPKLFLHTRMSEERLAAALRAFASSTSHGILAVDRSGIIQLVNRRAEALFGYENGELLGRPIEVLVPERVRHIHAEEVKDYSEDPRVRPMGIGIDIVGRRSDGSEFPVEISLNPVQVGDELVILGMIADITERTEIEQHARRAEKMEAVGRLAGGVAHELNRFFALISAHIGLVRDNYQGDATLSGSLEAISASLRDASILMKQLLAISGDQTVQPSWFDPNEHLSEMRDRLSHLLGADIHLELILEQDIGEILADPAQLERVIVTLVRNARDAMPSGGTVKIATAAIDIDESSSYWHLPVTPGPHIMLTVTDTGTGLSPEVASHLFEPFFTTRMNGQAKGLGLATVYGILKNCGGSISASATLNEGTTIQVILPRIRGVD